MKKVVSLLLIGLLMVGCGKKEMSVKTKPLILVTLSPYLSFAKDLANDLADVEVLTPDAINPHMFEPKPKDAKRILNVDIWFRLGDSFENKIEKTLQSKGKCEIVNLSKAVNLIKGGCCDHAHHHHHHNYDYHIWLSPKEMKKQVELIARTLQNRFPASHDEIQIRLDTLVLKLDTLSEELKEILEPMSPRTFLSSHATFAYLCRDYNLKELSVEFHGKSPKPTTTERMMRDAEDSGATKVLCIKGFNDKGALILAERLQLDLYYVDSYRADYIENLKEIAHILAKPYSHDPRT